MIPINSQNNEVIQKNFVFCHLLLADYGKEIKYNLISPKKDDMQLSVENLSKNFGCRKSIFWHFWDVSGSK